MASSRRKLFATAVKQRDESDARTANANMASKTALGRLDLRGESEVAAKTTEDDSCKWQAALHASEAALCSAEAALRALDSLRRSSDRSSLPSAVLQAIFAFAVRALLSSRCFTALPRIASSTAMPPAGSAPDMGWCWSSLGVGCCCCSDASRAHK